MSWRGAGDFNHHTVYDPGVVFSLVYVSAAANPTLPGLRALLDQCRRDNAAADITGLLLYRGGQFMQIIEGRQDRVESLYGAIEADIRHRDVTLVRCREQASRQFPTWSMGFSHVDVASTAPVTVEMPPPEGPTTQTESEAIFVRELLDLFDP